MSNRVRVQICSLTDYEEVVAELYLGSVFIGLISVEESDDKPVLELDPETQPLKMPLRSFLWAIEYATGWLKGVPAEDLPPPPDVDE